MTELYLYKLTSGETVIGEFCKSEIINERTGEIAHMVRFPMVVHRDYTFSDWVIGCIDEVVPMSMNSMLLIATAPSLDSVLAELYTKFVYGDDAADQCPLV